MAKKNVVVLGATGSIGRGAADVLSANSDRFSVYAVAAKNNIDELVRQNDLLKPEVIITAAEEKYPELRKNIPAETVVQAGMQAMVDVVQQKEVDIVLCSIVGTAGILPVLAALKAGKRVALASKEVLVLAGELVMQAAADSSGGELIPVDSEHSGVFQAIAGRRRDEIAKIWLTASGGPFRNWSAEKIANATVAEALAHPTWNMGRKITIDSASMMNKALELVEARYLFQVAPEKLAVVIHPQSIVHSMVEMTDGALIAQLAPPDMRFAIQYALTYPERCNGNLPKLDWAKLAPLTFEEPDHRKFPSLDFAEEALRTGGTLPTVMNAANEVAVEKFKHGEIAFPEIWSIVEKTMDAHDVRTQQDFAEIEAAAREAREFAARLRG